jgi:hypothetical protein
MPRCRSSRSACRPARRSSRRCSRSRSLRRGRTSRRIQLRSCQHRRKRTQCQQCALVAGRGGCASVQRWCALGLRRRSPKEDGHRAARRGGTPAGTGTGRPMSGARVRTHQERGGTGRATRHARREVVFGPRRGQRTCLRWGVERHGQQAAQRVQHILAAFASWPQLTTVAGCENWRQSTMAVKFHHPSNGDGCRRKTAKGPRNPEETGISS